MKAKIYEILEALVILGGMAGVLAIILYPLFKS